MPNTHFLNNHFKIIPNLRLGLRNGLPRSDLPIETLHAPLLSLTSAVYPAHLILLDFIT